MISTIKTLFSSKSVDSSKPKLDVNSILQIPLDADEYSADVFNKTQIYIHHTAGGSNPFNIINGWNNDAIGKVATAFIIAGKPDASGKYKDGDICQTFQSKYWAYNLGVKESVFKEKGLPYIPLDKTSIGIELTNWGQLTLNAKGQYINYVGGVVPVEEVCSYQVPHRGFYHYHKYTDAQIESLRKLLVYLCDKYGIKKEFNHDIFDVTGRALRGENGIFTHCSVRSDKVDCSPQPELVEMLSNL